MWHKINTNSKNGIRDDYCIGDTKRHKAVLNILHDFKKIYNNKKFNIGFMHYVENSHDTNNRFDWVDDDLYDLLSTGNSEGLFNNTVIFLYSDHGRRFNDKRMPQQYLEERLPFFSVYIPEHFKKSYPKKYENFKINTNRLTSPFDIYQTVRDLTCISGKNNINDESNKNRSISLFDKISIYRNCDDIGKLFRINLAKNML